MTGGNSIVNLGDLAKPATVLIEKISGAIGVCYEPTRIKRKARAEAEAKTITQLADLGLQEEREQRAVSRLLTEETRKQENIEDITREALNNLNEDAKPEDIEDDWISHFFEKCKIVSDTEMKNLWARVLAGQANNPGSFSRRTVDFISSMDKKDANDFTNLCRYVLTSRDPNLLITVPYLLIPEMESNYFSSRGISNRFLMFLKDIGLINYDGLSNISISNQAKHVVLYYGSQLVDFDMVNDSGNKFDLGAADLTQIGRELSAISGAQVDDTFLPYLKIQYEKSGVKVSF